LLTHLACNYLNAGKEAQRWGTAHESLVPYQVSTDLNPCCVHRILVSGMASIVLQSVTNPLNATVDLKNRYIAYVEGGVCLISPSEFWE